MYCWFNSSTKEFTVVSSNIPDHPDGSVFLWEGSSRANPLDDASFTIESANGATGQIHDQSCWTLVEDQSSTPVAGPYVPPELTALKEMLELFGASEDEVEAQMKQYYLDAGYPHLA